MSTMAERLRELIAVNRAIVSTLDYDEVLHLVVEKTAVFTHADACALLLLDDQNVLRVAASQGIDPEVAGKLAAPLSEHINVAVREMLGYREEDTFLGTPVIHRGHIAGLLVVCRRGHGDPSAEEEYLIGALADQAAIALEHARRYGEVAHVQAHQSRLLESIQSNTTTYLVYLDRRLRFAEANAAYCRASGRPREELLGRSFSEVHTGPELEAALQKVLLRGEPAELHELPEVDGSGATVWWDWSVRPICDPDDGVEGLVLSAVDVTEEVRTRAALESASRQKDEFLAMLAHELRNPLSAIASAMELVGADSTGTTMRTRAREIASRQIDQMTRLLDDLLDVSRITSGRIRLERRRLDLRAVVEQAVEATMPLIGARRHALAVHLPDTPAMVDGDRHRLVQVVSNLLTNAAKYTPPEGHIDVEVRRTDSTFELHVSDDGAGIAPEFLPHVFDLFSQGSRTLDRTEGGLGIGLTVVSRLVKMHGGEVEAHSEGLGRGSEVIARFPALAARGTTDSAPESGGARPRSRRCPGGRCRAPRSRASRARRPRCRAGRRPRS